MASVGNNAHEKWIQKAEEHFAQWDKLFYLWKSFNCNQFNLLETYVGLALFGYPNNYDCSNVNEIFNGFSEDNRKSIGILSNKFQFEKSLVTIGHTYLYLDDGRVFCVLRQIKTNNEITFIDVLGREYKSWNDFINTNKLPKCRYVAPIDGLHKMKQQLLVYKSPAASLDAKLLRVGDFSAAAATIGGAGLIALAIAPVSAMVLGSIGTGYCVGRSIGILADRSEHKESIALDNVESVVCWLTIGTSGVTGVSSLALSKSAQIFEACGAYSRIGLKVLNYAALTCNVCNFGTFVYVLQRKIANGEELTSMDLLEACVNVFMIYGAVSSTRQMHKYINSLGTTPATTAGKLTRTVKRRLQRQRAKLRNSNSSVGTDAVRADVNEVTILEDKIPSLGINFIMNTGQRFLARHFNISDIYYKCLEIWDTCSDFRYQKIGLTTFAFNLVNHLQNLIILITDAMVSIKAKVKTFIRQYFNSEELNSSIEQIGHMLEKTTTTVNNIDETLQENENESESTENEPKLMYEIIIEAAKKRIPRAILSCEILSVFNKQLSSLIEEITTEVNDNYEEWVSKNIEKMGKEKADELFSKVKIKTLNDFADKNFAQVMKSKNINMDSENVVNEEILQKMFTLYESLLLKGTSRNTLSKLGFLETCSLLRISLSNFFNPLCKKFKFVIELYEMNSTFIGDRAAMDLVCESLNVKLDRCYTAHDSTFFDIVAKSLNHNKIGNELCAAIMEKKGTMKVSNQLSDENIQVTVISLCDKFYQKVSAKLETCSDAEREKRLKDSYHYFMENFTSLMQKMEKEQNAAISEVTGFTNTKLSNQKTFISYYRNIYQEQKCETFASVVEHFTQRKNLDLLVDKYIAEHKLFGNLHVPVCNQINEEDGIRIYSLDEGIFPNLRAYKRNAAKLFDLDENRMELIKWEKGVVILKCDGDKNVVFQTTDIRSMIVMEIDTSKEPISE